MIVHVQSPAHLNGAATVGTVAPVKVNPTAITASPTAGGFTGVLCITTGPKVPVTLYADPGVFQA